MHELQLEFQLPGGLVHEGVRLRRGWLHPITGRVELAMAQVEGDDRLTQVDRLLVTTIARIGEFEFTSALAGRLTEGDREYLLLQLVTALRGRQHWLSARCRNCREVFDLGLDLGQLPVGDAGPDFPWSSVDLDGHTFELRAPVCGDIHALRGLPDPLAARALLRRCVLHIDEQTPSPAELDQLSEAMLDHIDVALDELCPAVTTRLATNCPTCGVEQEVELDLLEMLVGGPDAMLDLFEEVHVLARTYHWAEPRILALPRERRQLYLRFIDRDRGMISEATP